MPGRDAGCVRPVGRAASRYALPEEHKIDEAEKRHQEALEINPNDDTAQGKMRYIG